jgi:thiol-disulfide isomerase/thioredoxin
LDESRINQTWKEYFEELKAFLGNNKLLWQYYAFVFLEYDLNDKILNFLVSNLGFFSSGSDIDKAILHEIYQKKKITIGTKIDNFCLGLSKSICLDKIKQTNIVFHFYADWCKPCITELPELKKFIKNTQNDSLFMFIVRVDNKKDDSRYLKGFENMDNVRIVDDQIDEKSKISDFFLISDLPTNVWITNNLIIKGVKVGLNWLKNRL